MVVGKLAIHFAKQLNHLAAQGAEDAGRRGARNAVARVNDDLHGACQSDVTHDALGVIGQHVQLRDAAATLQLPGLGFDHLAQALDFVAINGAAAQHHLETVVVLGVVATGDLDATLACGAGREVQHGRGGQANVDHLDACGHQAANQRCREFRAAQAPITPHGHSVLSLRQGMRSKGFAQAFRHLRVQR